MIESVFLATAIPLLFLGALVRGENRWLVAFFGWGIGAFLMAHYALGFLTEYLSLNRGNLTVTFAPIVEEAIKALPLLGFAFVGRSQGGSAWNRSLLFFAFASGVGFSIQENYLYIVNADPFRALDTTSIAIARGLSTSIMHGLTTGLVGLGVMFVRHFEGGLFWSLLFGLYSLAVISHSLFNLYVGYTDFGDRFALVLMPLAFGALWLASKYALMGVSTTGD